MKSLITLLILSLSIIVFSCKKNDPKPDPAPLSKADAQAKLSESKATFTKDSLSFVATTSTISSLLNSNLRQGNGLPNSLAVSISSLRFTSETDSKVLNEISKILANLALDATLPNVPGGRIPRDTEQAKGIWELQLLTSTSYVDWYVCYNNTKRTYIYYDFIKTGTSSDIVIKFPSTPLNYSYNCSSLTSFKNNAVYTITNLKMTPYTYKYCSNGVETSYSDTAATNITAKLEIDGSEVLFYQSSSNIDYSKYYSAGFTGTLNTYLKVKNFEYELKYDVQNDFKVGTYYYGWKKDGEFLKYQKANIDGDGYTPTFTCTSTSGYGYPLIKTYNNVSYEMVTSGLKLASNFKLKEYISEIEKKYGDSGPYAQYDSATYNRLYADTLLHDKYFSNYGLYQSSDGSKVGSIKIRINPDANSNLYYRFASDRVELYLVYLDGTKELLSKKTNYPYAPGKFFTIKY